MTNTTLEFIYLALVSLCYNYSFIYDLLFIHSEAIITVIEKCSLKFWSTQPLAFQKRNCYENSAKLPKNIRFGVLKSSTFSGLLGVRKTTRLERFMFVLNVQKKACRRNFSHLQRCALAIACFVWRSLNYLYSLFGSEIYVLLNEKDKYIYIFIYIGPIRSAI